MCNTISDVPDILHDTVLEGIVFIALFDLSELNEKNSEDLYSFLLTHVIDLYNYHTYFYDVDEDDTTNEDLVQSISDDLPITFNWSTRDEMFISAALTADLILDMYTEYDVTCEEVYHELSRVLDNTLGHITVDPTDVEAYVIDIKRKKVSLYAAVQRSQSNVANFFMEQSNESSFYINRRCS